MTISFYTIQTAFLLSLWANQYPFFAMRRQILSKYFRIAIVYLNDVIYFRIAKNGLIETIFNIFNDPHQWPLWKKSKTWVKIHLISIMGRLSKYTKSDVICLNSYRTCINLHPLKVSLKSMLSSLFYRNKCTMHG